MPLSLFFHTIARGNKYFLRKFYKNKKGYKNKQKYKLSHKYLFKTKYKDKKSYKNKQKIFKCYSGVNVTQIRANSREFA